MSSSSLQIVNDFSKLLQEENYAEAASLLHEDKFKFSSPKDNFDGKANWLEGFPKIHKDGPTYGEPCAAEDDAWKVTRSGFKKVGFLKFNVLETITVDESTGTILEISAAMTKA